MPVLPIKPTEVVEQKKEIPEGVIEIFNGLIAKSCSNGKAVVPRKAALSAIALKLHVGKDKVIANGWLDIGDLFKAAGWEVVTLAPPYSEEEMLVFSSSSTKKDS